MQNLQKVLGNQNFFSHQNLISVLQYEIVLCQRSGWDKDNTGIHLVYYDTYYGMASEARCCWY